MSESATRSELGQVLDEIKAMRSDIQSMDKKLDIHIVKTEEQFNTLRTEINAVRTELKAEIKALDDKVMVQIKAVQGEINALDDKVTDLGDRQKIVDSRLWGFIVALTGAIVAYLVKLSFFDKV